MSILGVLLAFDHLMCSCSDPLRSAGDVREEEKTATSDFLCFGGGFL